MGLKMSAQSSGSVLSARSEESTRCILRTPPMARGSVQVNALLEPKFQLIERTFSDPQAENGNECLSVGSFSSDPCKIC